MKWFSWSTILIVVIALVWWVLVKQVDTTDALNATLSDIPEPLAVCEWKDGYRFEVLKVGVGSVEDGSLVAPSGSLLTPVETRSSKFIDRKMTSVEVLYFSVDGVPAGLRCSSIRNTPGLMLLCRLIDDSGSAIESDAVLSEGYVFDTAISEKGSFSVDPLEFRGREETQKPDAPGERGIPDLLIQVRDEEFGWITGEGVLTLKDEVGHRLLAQFPAWPRDTLANAGKLEFRVIRAGVEEMAEFQVPGASISDATMSAAKHAAKLVDFPSAIEGEDYRIEFKEWAFEENSESYPFVGLSSEFVSKMPGDVGRLKDEGFNSFSQSDFYWQFAESDDGNRVSAQMRRFEGMGYEPAFLLPLESEDYVIVEGELLRRVGYPRYREECVFLGSGEVAADGTTMNIVMDGEAGKIGLKHFNITLDSSAECILGDDAKKKKMGFKGYRIDFALEIDKATAAAYEARLGEFLEWEPVVFLDDAEYSAGVIDSNGSQAGESFTGTRDVSGSYHWEVRVKAGQKIRVGLAKRKEDEVIRIRFPVTRQEE